MAGRPSAHPHPRHQVRPTLVAAGGRWGGPADAHPAAAGAPPPTLIPGGCHVSSRHAVPGPLASAPPPPGGARQPETRRRGGGWAARRSVSPRQPQSGAGGGALAPPTAPPSPGSTAPPETPRREQWEGEDGGGGGAQQTSSGSSHPSLCPSGDLALCGQGLGPWLRPAATPPPTCLTSGAPTSPEPPSLQPRAPGWPLGLPGVCDARQGRAKHQCGLLLPSRHGEVFQGPAVSLAGALPAVQGETGTR